MPAVTRELSITYGSTVIGGTSTAFLLYGDPPYRFFKNYERALIEAHVVCRGTSESDFNTQCAALEAAFRKPNQLLKVTLGSTDLVSLTHTGNTGVLSRATCEKVGHAMDSGRARLYKISVTAQLPADLTGKDGLREAEIEVAATSSGVRSYKVAGAYTALSSNSAVAQYEASIAALLASLESDLTGTWERLGHGYTRDDENKVVRFVRSGLEVIYNQSASGVDHAAVKEQRLVVVRAHIAPGDYQGAERPLELLVSYEAAIDKSQSTDLTGFWDSTIKPWLLSHARTVSGASSVALVRSAPVFDYPGNRISAQMELIAVAGSTFLARSIKTTDDLDEGLAIWPVWDGTPFGAEVFEGKKIHVRIVRDESLRLGATFSSGGGAGGNVGGGGGGGVFGGLGAFGIGGNAIGGLAGPHQGGLGIFGIGNGGELGNPNFGVGGGGAGGGGANLGVDGGGAVQPENGFVVIRRIDESEPHIVGTTDAQFSVTREVRTTIMQRVDAPGVGGGSGSGGSGLTSAR